MAKSLLKTALVGNQFYLSGAVQILLDVEDEGNPIIEFSVLSISVQPAGNVKWWIVIYFIGIIVGGWCTQIDF